MARNKLKEQTKDITKRLVWACLNNVIGTQKFCAIPNFVYYPGCCTNCFVTDNTDTFKAWCLYMDKLYGVLK